MRNWSQQQSPSEVVAVLSDLVLHPAQTFYHSWNWKAALLSAMLPDFSLYDAIHAEFRAVDTLDGFPPYAWSTPATLYADAVTAASSALAQTFFRAVGRFGRQDPFQKSHLVVMCRWCHP